MTPPSRRAATYHFSVHVHQDFDTAVQRTREALADEGFGILTEIDVQATLKDKLGVDMGRYLILGACNPPFAHKALKADPGIGTLLPCNVVVRETPNGVLVDFMDPAIVLDLVKAPGIAGIADDVRTRLEMVRDSLATG